MGAASFCVAGPAALGAPTFIEVGGSPATSDAFGRSVASAALGAPQARFAWQAQHSEHLRLVLRGRRSTWSTFLEVGGSLATSDANGCRLVWRGRCSTWSTSGSFFVAGAALGAAQARFVWQAQHLEHLRRGRQKSGDD